MMSGNADTFSGNVLTEHSSTFNSQEGEGLVIHYNHRSSWGTYYVNTQYRCITSQIDDGEDYMQHITGVTETMLHRNYKVKKTKNGVYSVI